MNKYDSSFIRNIAVLGHSGSGKTSLIESMLMVTKAIQSKGKVESKNTISDFLPYEQEKKCSFNTTVNPVFYKDYKINLIDVPGGDEFIAECENVLNICKGAILLIDATKGVEVGTKKCYRKLLENHVPTIIMVNKMDKENVNFNKVFEDIRNSLGKNAVLFTWPTGHEDNFDGFVNVVDMKARIYNGVECEDAEIYQDKKMKVLELHNMLLESVAQTDEELLEKFFNGEDLTRDEIHNGLRVSVLDGELMPVIVGSVEKNIAMHTLLDMLIDYLPNPSDLKPIDGTNKDGELVSYKTTNEEPFSAYIFKTVVDPFLGVISYFKINSGTINSDDQIVINQNKVETVKDLFVVCGKKYTPVKSLNAGDIGALSKISDLLTGDSISGKDGVMFEGYKYPTPTQYVGLVASTKNDEDKMSVSVSKILLEDPGLQLVRNAETKQLLLGGAGMQHLDYSIDKLKRNYKVSVDIERQKIVYRETIRNTATAQGKYVKQSGGSGFYGVVEMEFKPTTEESNFNEKVFGGSVPRNYFPAVEKGFYEALEVGLLAGYPVINVEATLLDGKYHAVDSNELAFKMAAIFAFKEAFPKLGSVLLEPVMRVVVNVDDMYLGEVIGDVSHRRGKITSIEPQENLTQNIIALIPEAEIIDYKMDLSSLTQGNGTFSREFDSFQEVPDFISKKIIEK